MGGVVDKTIFMNGNGDCNAMVFHFVCTMDPSGSGGIIVGTDLRLLNGCGPSASDAADSHQWEAHLAVATQTNQTPDPSVCVVGTANQASDNSWSCTQAFDSCFHTGILACSSCCDNDGDIGAGVSYANVPK